MNCIIIDDEPLARKGIRLLAEQVADLYVLDEFPNPLPAIKFLQQENSVDLIFLDIEMPGINGIEFLENMPPKAMVILTTAYPQYALDAFELDVLDYLLKPIKLARFLKAVEKARELKELKLSSMTINSEEPFFYIKSERKFVKLGFEDILYIKGLKDYVVIHTASQKYMTAMNISTILKQLPPAVFSRVSKSYVINVNKIKSVESDLIYIGHEEIPLGNSYKDEFISEYIKSKLISR